MKTLVLAGTMAAVVAAAGAAPAAAPVPPKWLTARDLSAPGPDAVIPDVAVDTSGDSVVVWAQTQDSNWTAQVVERPAGGSWTAPQQLSDPATQVASPQVAIGGSTTVAIWIRSDSNKNLITQASDLDPKTGTWAVATSLSREGRDAQSPSLAVNARGDAVAVWASVGLGGWTIEGAYGPAGGPWQSSVPLTGTMAGTEPPDVVVDPAGNATAVWPATTGSGWQVYAAHRGPDGSWTAPVALSGIDPTGSIAPQLAMEGSGAVTAVWSRPVGKKSVIELATRNPVTGAWSPAKRLFPTAPSGFAPRIAVDKRGDGVMLWTTSGQAGLTIVTSVRRPGGAWSPPFPLQSAGIGPMAPEIALDAKGDAVAVWTRPVSGSSRVQAASLPAGGSAWTAPRSLSIVGGDAATPQVTLDASGDGTVAWARFDGQSFVVQGAGYDASAPVLDQLSMPTTGFVGKRLTFAVTPKDVWSAVRTVRWNFGDGAVGTGKLTGHAYARPGRYAAQVTATDSIGHVRTARRWVKISAR